MIKRRSRKAANFPIFETPSRHIVILTTRHTVIANLELN